MSTATRKNSAPVPGSVPVSSKSNTIRVLSPSDIESLSLGADYAFAPILNGETFILAGIDMCYANAIRRIIQTDIPIACIRGILHKTFTPDATYKLVNTSPFDNEQLEQRLRCVPISLKRHHTIADIIKRWILVIDVANTSDVSRVVTSADFKLLDPETQEFMPAETVRQLFPPYMAPNGEEYFIELVKLRPRISDSIPGEQLTIRCELGEGTQKENGCFNVCSTIACSPVVDSAKSAIARDLYITKCREQNMSDEEIESERRNWPLLTGQRYVHKNMWKFVMQSVGIFDTTDILAKACDILRDKFDRIIQSVEGVAPAGSAESESESGSGSSYASISPANADIENSYDLRLNGEDYTVGNIIRYELYTSFYPGNLSFVGFKKFHPHDTHSIVRLAYRPVNASSASASASASTTAPDAPDASPSEEPPYMSWAANDIATSCKKSIQIIDAMKDAVQHGDI